MTQSFQALGVSAPVVRALAARAIHSPFAIQQFVLPDALAGLDILAQSPTGSGKTLAFGIPLVERTDGASGRPAALVLVPTRELALQVAEDLTPAGGGEAAFASRPSTAASRSASQASAARTRARRDRHAGSHARPARTPDDRARPRARPRPRRGRPDARHGLQAAGRPDPADRAEEPPDDALLGDARRRRRASSHATTRVNPSRFAADGAAESASSGEIEHTFVPVTVDAKLDRLVAQLRERRGRTLVFVRTKHGADKLAQEARQRRAPRGRDAREPLAEPARARARPLHVGQGADARRHGRRRARPRCRRHHPRDQLRPAARSTTTTCTVSAAPAARAATALG